MIKTCSKCKTQYDMDKQDSRIEFIGWQSTKGLNMEHDRIALFNCPCGGTMPIWPTELGFTPEEIRKIS